MMQIALRNLRELKDENTRAEIVEFIKRSAGLPESAIAVFDDVGAVSLLVDDQNRLLRFR